MNTVTIDSSWLTTNGPAPYHLSADDTVYNLTADVNVVPTQPTFTAVRGSALATPVNSAFATATTGGTLAAGTYFYRVAATNAQGISLPSTETSQVVPSGTSTNTVTVNWGAVAGATGYKVYGRSTGAELLIGTVGAVTTFVDTGAVTPAGALPTAATRGVASVTVVQGSKFGPNDPPLITFPAPVSGTAATGYCVVDASGNVSVVVKTPGAGYTGSESAPTGSGGKIWFTGEVFLFPDDKTGRTLRNIELVTNGHLIQVNGESCPQKHDARLYRRTSEYTSRVNTADTPHTFGGTVYDGTTSHPVNDPNVQAVNYEYPPLFNESKWADVK